MTAHEEHPAAHVDMEEEFGLGARLAASVVKGILIALPVSYLLLVPGLWLLTDRNMVRALETAILPGVLIGVFFGGFFGMTITGLSIERSERRARSGRLDRK